MKVNIATHSGKLEGLRSISTSVFENPICAKRAKTKGSVCGRCYARRIESFRPTLRKSLCENTSMLRKRLSDHDLPRIDDKFFRIESFGDVCSRTQAENYVRIAKANPNTRFAAWTKNLSFYKAAFDRLGKPDNFVLVFSSSIIGKEDAIPDKYCSIVDHRFTVMPKGTDPSRVTINCGGKKCIGCLLCYRKRMPFDIYEIEK